MLKRVHIASTRKLFVEIFCFRFTEEYHVMELRT